MWPKIQVFTPNKGTQKSMPVRLKWSLYLTPCHRFMGKHHIWGHFSIAQNVWGIWNMAWRGIWGSSSIRGEISLSSPSLAPTLTSPCNFFWHINSHGLAFNWIILEKSKNNCTLIHAFHYMWNIFDKLFVYFVEK